MIASRDMSYVLMTRYFSHFCLFFSQANKYRSGNLSFHNFRENTQSDTVWYLDNIVARGETLELQSGNVHPSRNQFFGAYTQQENLMKNQKYSK